MFVGCTESIIYIHIVIYIYIYIYIYICKQVNTTRIHSLKMRVVFGTSIKPIHSIQEDTTSVMYHALF